MITMYSKYVLISQASHGRTMLSLTKTDENLSASLLNITALEKSLSAADEKYQFMQKLRDFVSSICDFLQVCYRKIQYGLHLLPKVFFCLLTNM